MAWQVTPTCLSNAQPLLGRPWALGERGEDGGDVEDAWAVVGGDADVDDLLPPGDAGSKRSEFEYHAGNPLQV